MSGLTKATEYDWKDSNVALFGSDTDKQVKKESAETEQAWAGSGESVGVKIWRINKFQVEEWPKESYGEFYTGDSYIIMNTFKEGDSDELNHDIHFWIGKHSTQDEYGTAAYKTVELDTFHDDKPIQHREVQGYESELFKSYFDNITFLKGGADSGFRRVLPKTYTPRLIKVSRQAKKGRGRTVKITCCEVDFSRANITDEDVFVIDLGNNIIRYDGENSSHDERFSSMQYVNDIMGSRGGRCKMEIIDDTADLDEIAGKIGLVDNGKSDDEINQVYEVERKLYKVCDADGSLDMEEVSSGSSVSLDQLTPDAVYLVNTGNHCFAWIGDEASIEERRNALAYANNYVNSTEAPFMPITVVRQSNQGQLVAAF